MDEQRLLDKVSSMDGNRFEQFVSDLWEVRGWDTTVTRKSRDRGVDIIAKKSTPFNQKQAIQTKCNSINNKVTGPDIQQYSSLKHQIDDADIVVIVTTSDFTTQARQLSSKLNVKLIDGSSLIRLLSESEGTGIFEKYSLSESKDNHSSSRTPRSTEEKLNNYIEQYVDILNSGDLPELNIYTKENQKYPTFSVEFYDGDPDIRSVYYIFNLSDKDFDRVLEKVSDIGHLYVVIEYKSSSVIWLDYKNSKNWTDSPQIFSDIIRILKIAYSTDINGIEEMRLFRH
ncbi:restriction endonuclease [Halobacterium salinarum]|uniref:restriction endonuclease n=1 Tax=Halobacterium salinarum TaxID=2242 RepID=UPI0025524C12|nr:restriction endonuclease [Halobacterium salinarum]MDL0130441.1 restriction endonuclease [Halobacterium salinarum]